MSIPFNVMLLPFDLVLNYNKQHKYNKISLNEHPIRAIFHLHISLFTLHNRDIFPPYSYIRSNPSPKKRGNQIS